MTTEVFSKETQERAGFTSFVDSSGEVVYRKYPLSSGQVKWRQCVTKKFWTEGGSLPILGGTQLWNAGSANAVVVVEGEEDFVSALEMTNLPVVYLTSASIKSDRSDMHKYLNPWNKIILAFESDEAGVKAKNIISTMFPDKVFEASLTKYKDANEYLLEGEEREFHWAIINAKRYTPDFVFSTMADFKGILESAQVNTLVPTPFKKLNEGIRGLPLRKVVLLTGQEGLGKTELLRALEFHVLKNHPDFPISITHHEESKDEVLRGLASYALERNCKDPDDPVSNETIIQCIAELSASNNLFLTDISMDDSTVNSIMDKFRYLVTVCGVKYIFVDPINQFNCENEGEGDLVRFFDTLAKRMSKFCIEYDVGCVWTAHVNDDGQTRNSRMIGKAASIRLDVDRDHMSEDPTVRNLTKIRISKNRPFSTTGYGTEVVFDPVTFTIKEKTIELPF